MFNRTRVVCPIIDVISDDNFEYIPASDMTWGGFNWRLNFRWYRVPQREIDRRNGDRSEPVRSVLMTTLLSISHKINRKLSFYLVNICC